MEKDSNAYQDWAHARMIAYRDAGEVLTQQRDRLLQKNRHLYSWLCLSVVVNVIFIGFYLFYYFKTH